MTSYRDPLANALEDLAVRRAHLSALLGELRPAHRAVLSNEERAALANAAHELEVVPSTMEEVERIVDRLEAIEHVVERAKTALSVDTTASEAPAARKTVDGIGMWLTHVVAPWKGSVEQESKRWLAHAVVGGVDVQLEATIVRAVGGAIRQLRFVTESQVPRALGAIALERQRTMQTLAKALFLASEKELGERVLDDAYWVTGDDDTLRAVIGEEVRACLASLADRVQAFEIRDGTARLTWTTPPIEDVNAVLYEAFDPHGQRTATEQLVPRTTFDLHRAIRAALQPTVVSAPPPSTEIDIVIEPLADPSHVTDATQLALVRSALERHLQGKAEARAQLDALGLRDLAVLEELAAAYDAPEVADLAAERAQALRKDLGANRRAGASTLAARFLAEDASDELRMFVMERLRNDEDTAYVAELMAHLVADDGQAFARVLADDRIYDTRTIEKGVAALVDHGRSEVAAVLLGLPAPICIDASMAFASIARTSQQGDTLASRVEGLETEVRRQIVWKLVSGSAETRFEIVRRFFGDEDPMIRSATIGALLHRPSEEDTPALLRALRDPDRSVRESAVRACEGAWALPAVREDALSELRATYARDPSVRDATMRSIVSLRRSKREACDARAEFERALARLSAERPAGYDSALEDVVYFGHAMMAALGAQEPVLLAAFRHPRAGELAAQLMWRLSPAGLETAIEAVLGGATTPDGERLVLALLDHRLRSDPYPTSLLQDLLARAPTAHIRERAAAALADAPPDYTASYY